MTAIEGWDTVTVSLDNTESLVDNPNTSRLQIESRIGDEVHVFVDGGSAGSSPPSYDMTIQRYSPYLDDWMVFNEVTGSTENVHVLESPPWEVRVNITNQAGQPEDYRAELISKTYSRT